jgi:hypothetical protein
LEDTKMSIELSDDSATIHLARPRTSASSFEGLGGDPRATSSRHSALDIDFRQIAEGLSLGAALLAMAWMGAHWSEVNDAADTVALRCGQLIMSGADRLSIAIAQVTTQLAALGPR